VPTWETAVIWSLRVAVLVTAAIFMTNSQWIFGVFCVIAVFIAMIPTAIARNAKFAWPFEIELVLLWFLLTHLTLGYLLGLYTRVTWFDKTLHFGNSGLIGFVAFFAVYLAHYLRHDRPHPWLDGIAILFATLGFGALWEIAEFSSDYLFGTHAQGSPTLPPLVDTMWDLILDGLGGVLAAILGPLYMHHSKRSRRRVAQFAAQVEARRARATGLKERPYPAHRSSPTAR
jgi:hypothetical protein